MPRTILIVDDLCFYRFRIRNFLRRMEYVVYEADSGEEGCRLARSIQPVVVLLDEVMPGLGGAETYARLRAEGFSGEVIVLSPRPDGPAARSLLKAGVRAVLPKAVSPDAIEAELRHLFDTASAA
jgi:DNA-binding NarL/FixJ family response regulator